MGQHGDDERADRSRSRDEHPLAAHVTGPADGVQRDRERLGERAAAQVDPVGQGDDLIGAHDDALGETALGVREAHRTTQVAGVAADVGPPVAALRARAARARRVDGDRRADGRRVDARAESRDRAGDLVPEHHRLLQSEVADAAVVDVVQVRAAHPAVGDVDRDEARARLGRGNRVDPQIVGPVDDAREHLRRLRLHRSV